MLALADQSQPSAIRGASERHGEGVPRWRGRSYLSVSVKTEKHTLAFKSARSSPRKAWWWVHRGGNETKWDRTYRTRPGRVLIADLCCHPTYRRKLSLHHIYSLWSAPVETTMITT
ncbi:unnamed protein product [Pleuronectes platessa]|uniref:Uncharacterized protein n=1 Tax=Pleuronectes platessa TaxID=8262 RepID=A0A9N7TTK9_PLEPL|nr:unnamed protein product [Pleuronectes platessa]